MTKFQTITTKSFRTNVDQQVKALQNDPDLVLKIGSKRDENPLYVASKQGVAHFIAQKHFFNDAYMQLGLLKLDQPEAWQRTSFSPNLIKGLCALFSLENMVLRELSQSPDNVWTQTNIDPYLNAGINQKITGKLVDIQTINHYLVYFAVKEETLSLRDYFRRLAQKNYDLTLFIGQLNGSQRDELLSLLNMTFELLTQAMELSYENISSVNDHGDDQNSKRQENIADQAYQTLRWAHANLGLKIHNWKFTRLGLLPTE
ncbi:hypothetical protein [Paucilactobacillus sp. N302-9]